LLLKVIKT